MSERWLLVSGYEGAYEVSDIGRVRSLDHAVQCRTRWGGIASRHVRGRILSMGTDESYPSVNLWVDGVVTHRRIHVLVAAAFMGPRPAGFQVCHKDGNQQNCRLSNLRYDTPMSNNADKKDHDTHLFGERCPWAKLTEDQVRAIRRKAARNSHELVASEYGISRGQVSRISRRERWSHVA